MAFAALRRSLSTAAVAPAAVDRVGATLGRIAHGMSPPTAPIEIASASGCRVTTADGDEYVDFTCGIGVTNTGHCHPRVVAAAREQLGRVVHAQIAVGLHTPMIELTARLVGEHGPGSGVLPASHDRVMYSTTGAEAVENALRLARAATGRPNVIVFQGGYHGRTHATLALTRSKTVYGAASVPAMPGVYVAPFPYATQAPGLDVGACLYQVELLLQQQTAPRDTAAVLLEPVLGEGGYVPAPPGLLEGLQALCARHGMLLMLDEVQTGFGRTGKMFAHEHYDGVEPDVLIMAKGIASGLPLSLISSRAELTQHSPAGTMGGTYAGNAVACAAALATLDVFDDERLLENARARGDQLVGRLAALAAARADVVRDVRGLGLMVGVELDPARRGAAAALARACAAEGLLLLSTSAFECVRFIPPLVVSEAEIDDAMERFEAAFDKTFPQ